MLDRALEVLINLFVSSFHELYFEVMGHITSSILALSYTHAISLKSGDLDNPATKTGSQWCPD